MAVTPAPARVGQAIVGESQVGLVPPIAGSTAFSVSLSASADSLRRRFGESLDDPPVLKLDLQADGTRWRTASTTFGNTLDPSVKAAAILAGAAALDLSMDTNIEALRRTFGGSDFDLALLEESTERLMVSGSALMNMTATAFVKAARKTWGSSDLLLVLQMPPLAAAVFRWIRSEEAFIQWSESQGIEAVWVKIEAPDAAWSGR